MVLAYAIWGFAVLATMALSVLSVGGATYRLGGSAAQAAQAEASVEWAVHRAVLGLLDRRVEHRWRVDGVPRNLLAGAFDARVSVQDELGRIDLNHADASLLIGLLASAGVPAVEAGRLSDRILDWREPGTLKRLNGAKEAEYADAQLSYRPRRGPFQSVDELTLVLGMTSVLFQRIAPALTVYSGRPTIDPQFAPREALLALPGASPTDVAGVVRDRFRGGSTARGVIDPSVPLAGRAFTIRVVVSASGGTYGRDAVVRLTDNPSQMYWVLNWSPLSGPMPDKGVDP